MWKIVLKAVKTRRLILHKFPWFGTLGVFYRSVGRAISISDYKVGRLQLGCTFPFMGRLLWFWRRFFWGILPYFVSEDTSRKRIRKRVGCPQPQSNQGVALVRCASWPYGNRASHNKEKKTKPEPHAKSHHVCRDFAGQPHLTRQPTGLSGWAWFGCVQDTGHHSCCLSTQRYCCVAVGHAVLRRQRWRSSLITFTQLEPRKS